MRTGSTKHATQSHNDEYLNIPETAILPRIVRNAKNMTRISWPTEVVSANPKNPLYPLFREQLATTVRPKKLPILGLMATFITPQRIRDHVIKINLIITPCFSFHRTCKSICMLPPLISDFGISSESVKPTLLILKVRFACTGAIKQSVTEIVL